MRDLKSDILVTALDVTPTDNVGGFTSTAIDMQGYNSLAVSVDVGTITTTGSLNLKLQDCDTVGGTYVDVPAEHLDGSLVAFATGVDQSVGYVGVKRFVKVVSVEVDVTVAQFNVIAVQGNPAQSPVA